MNPYTQEKISRWKQRLGFLQICKGWKSGDEKRLIFSQWKNGLIFSPNLEGRRIKRWRKKGLIFPIYLEGRKRELIDGDKKKILCQCKRKGFCLLQFQRKVAMNLVQDLSPDNLLSIRQLRIKTRKVERKVKMRQNKIRHILPWRGGVKNVFFPESVCKGGRVGGIPPNP